MKVPVYLRILLVSLWWWFRSQVCGSMPYDDSDVKKMIKYQTERKVGFSKSRKLSDEVKELIYGILEAKVESRFKMRDIKDSAWLQAAYRKLTSNARTHTAPAPTTTTRAPAPTTRVIAVTVPDTELKPESISRGLEVTAATGGVTPRSRAESRPAGE